MNQSPTFEELERDLYIAMGRLIQKWSAVESRLAHILTLLLTGSGASRQGETIYYALSNLQPRILVLKAAFFNRNDIAGDTQDRWQKIIDAISNESAERNSLIHGDFIRGTVNNGTQMAIAISPKIFSDMQRKEAPPGVQKLGFDTTDVLRHVERMDHLKNALWALYGELPNADDSKPPLTFSEYLHLWNAARGIRQWPSIKA